MHYPFSGGFYELSSQEKQIIDSLYTSSVLNSLEDIYHNSIANSAELDLETDRHHDYDKVRRYIIGLAKKISFIIESNVYMSSFEKLFGSEYSNSISESSYYTVLPNILSSLENCAKASQNFQSLEAKNKSSFDEINVELGLEYEKYKYDSADDSVGFSSPTESLNSTFVDKESFLKLIKSMSMVNSEGNVESLEDSFDKNIIPVLKQEIFSNFLLPNRGELSSDTTIDSEKIKQFVIKFSKSVTDLDSFLNSYQQILDGLDVDGTPIGDFPEGSIDKRNIPGASLKQTGVDEFRFTLKYSQFQKQFPFMKDAAIKNGITIIYFMTKDTSMSFTPEETTAFGVTLDPQSVAHDISHIIDDYKEHEAYRKFRDDPEIEFNDRMRKERRSTGTTGLINDSDREALAALANEYIGLTQVCASFPDIKVKIPDNDEILTDFWVSSGIFGSLRDVRRRMFSRQDSLHEFFGSYINNLSKKKEGIKKQYPAVLPVTDPRRGGGVGHDPFLQSVLGNDFISLRNIDSTRGQLMVSDDTFDIRDEKEETFDSIVHVFDGKIGRLTPENKVDLTGQFGRLFAIDGESPVQLLLIKNDREFIINLNVLEPDESGDSKTWYEDSDSAIAIPGEIESTLFFRENSQDELDMDEILEQLDDVDTSDPHFNLQDYLSELDVDELDLNLDFSAVVKVTEIGVCRAYQFYKVCEAYGKYSDYFAIEDPENKLDNSAMRKELTEILSKWERMDGNAIGYISWDGSEFGNENRWNNPDIIDFVLNKPGSEQKFRRGFISNMCGKVNISIDEIDRENIVNDIQEPISKEQFAELLASVEEPFLTQKGIDEAKKYLENSTMSVYSQVEEKRLEKTLLKIYGDISFNTVHKYVASLSYWERLDLVRIISENYNPSVIDKIKKLNNSLNWQFGILENISTSYILYIVLGLSGKQIIEAIDKKSLKFYKTTHSTETELGEEVEENKYGEPHYEILISPASYNRQILTVINEDSLDINSADFFAGKNITSSKLGVEFNLNDLQYPVNHGGVTNQEKNTTSYVERGRKNSEGITGPAFIRYIQADGQSANRRFNFNNNYDRGQGINVKNYPFKSIVETNRPLFKYFMTIGFDLVGGEDYYNAMFGGDESAILQTLMTKFKQKRKERPSVQAKSDGESEYKASSSTESGYREFVDGSFGRRKEIIDSVHDIYNGIFKGIMTPEVVFDDNEGLVSLQILAGN